MMRRTSGFSLIELMIAILIGSIVLLGITSLFSTTSNVNRMENGLARLQENGRFAMNRIAQDIRMASAVRGMRKDAVGGSSRVAADRPIISFVDFGEGSRAQFGLPASPSGNAYAISPAFFLRGHECGTSCAPAVAAAAGDGSDHFNRPGPNGGPIPAIGTSNGARAAGADVITVRYLQGLGQPLAEAGSGTYPNTDGQILIDPMGEGIMLGESQLVVIGDYSTTAIISVAEAAGGPYYTLTPQGNLGAVPTFSIAEDARVSSFDADFVTVTYYLLLQADPNPDVPAGRLISGLVRRENGLEQVIAEGIERLDFTYHLEDVLYDVHPMSADAISLLDPGLCPPKIAQAIIPMPSDDLVCGWRAVRAVEIHLLSNTVGDVGAVEETYQYSFLNSGEANAAGTLEVACDPSFGTCPPGSVNTLASGLGPGRMLRREFRTTAVVRNNTF